MRASFSHSMSHISQFQVCHGPKFPMHVVPCFHSLLPCILSPSVTLIRSHLSCQPWLLSNARKLCRIQFVPLPQPSPCTFVVFPVPIVGLISCVWFFFSVSLRESHSLATILWFPLKQRAMVGQHDATLCSLTALCSINQLHDPSVGLPCPQILPIVPLSGGNTEDISHQPAFAVKENLDDQGNQYLIECS